MRLILATIKLPPSLVNRQLHRLTERLPSWKRGPCASPYGYPPAEFIGHLRHATIDPKDPTDIPPYDALVAEGSWTNAKAKGLVRQEGRDYVMHEGDVVEFRFAV